MTELLASISGMIISLAFAYVPGLKEWFDNLAGNYKRLVMGLSLVLACLVIFGLSCVGWRDDVVCNQAALPELLSAVIFALIANQTAYTFAVK